ncbi:response regulator [Seonamhaeicola sediminis]|uniref:histidine kinase n=1 Tax=Seonamhaeicola sediminis TaxID=2528206 RepID=A0A562YD42_9FLAO|nr:two-component regulator propeller domain-containing protein [Seonamhaeicola sediminis]TWO32028.1 response regulator [Seonamhaeicola sediminis]
MKTKTFIFLIFYSQCTIINYAQTIRTTDSIPEKQIAFHNLNVEKGLSQNSVVSIAQDSIGFLWFATQDGLNKYDGKTFKYYNKQFEDVTKLNYSKLGKVYIDKTNTLWIISNSGKLEKYNNKTDDFDSVLNIASASNLYQDNNLNLFIGTYGNGLYAVNSKTKDTLQLFNKEDQTATIYDFLELDDHIVVSASNNVFKVSKKDFRYTKIISNQTPINYSAITKLPDSTISIGSYSHGLFLYNIKNTDFTKFTGFKNNPLPDDLNIESTLLDRYNRLWIATYGRGVYVINFNKKTIQNFMVQGHNPYALHYNDALDLFQDFTGNIWIGTDGAGLSYYDEHLLKFNVLTNDQLPRNVNVDVARAISVNPKNNLVWVGTSGKGLTSLNLNSNKFKTLTTDNSCLKSNRVMSLKHIDDELWIGYQDKGLNIIDMNNYCVKYNVNLEKELQTTPVWCIYQDKSNNIWLGTGGKGVLKVDKKMGVIESFTFDNDNTSTISSNNIRSICEGKNGVLWIGTEDKGLCSLNPRTKNITRFNTISDKIKTVYYNNETDILWIGTNGNGLKKFDPKTNETTVFSFDNGLPNNVIYAIIEDVNGYLWLSSNRGITMFKESYSKPIIVNYDQYDGLQAFEFNTGAYFKDHNNNMYFGGLDGINWFKPEQLSVNEVKPRTIIKDLHLFNKRVPLEPNKVFNHNESTISISFSSLHFSQPDLNNFKYQLVNHDKDWIESGNINTAYYSNLNPGRYTFKVISSNYDGIWNLVPAQYSFTIKKAWYNTTLARILYLLLGILTIVLIYRYFKWRWRINTKLRLEYEETQRLKNLDEFKSKLFTNISHEFRTPLTLILGPAEKQLLDKKISKDNKEGLALITQNAKRLLNLVDQLIDLTKLETGHLKLSVEQGDLSSLMHQLISAFKYQVQEKEIKLKTKVQELKNVWFDRDIIEKIIVNLLANAVKYTPKKGFINFNTTLQDNYVVITIINNGSTINSNDINKLFTRFYQVNSNSDGVGIGLALVKELVTLTNGSLIANTLNEDELQFTITLPVTKDAFKTEDIVIKKQEIKSVYNQSESLSEYEDLEDDLSVSNKPIVLVVEDNIQLRQYIKSILKEKYKVLMAINGKKGLKKAINKIPDLIISDIMMPEMDGIELCNTLKNDTLTSHVPVILLTAKTGESNELEGLEVGADDFISKPFNSKILIKRVENLINFSKSLQKRYTQHSNLRPQDIAINNVDEAFLSNIESLLEKRLSDPDFNTQTFSDLMAMSRMQLHRKLIALTGLSTSQFIRSQRLKRSLNLLQESDLTVSEVAYQVGFNTVSYFIKCFKEAYNNTPNSYIAKD